ncbi:MAG: hypothetical protein GX458_12320 [Phyllobacteriaceae bacterium]|nr:hypothetical protein [Phyllobacteriaceae bacterium]
MAGAVPRRRLTPADAASGFDVAFAGPPDEPDVRRLLAETPLGGSIGLAFTREPDAFDADFGLAERHAFVVARERTSGRLVGLAERLVLEARVGGRIRLLPHLGALRLAPSARGRISILRRGFALLRSLDRPDECPFALTSVTADNDAALRLLTRGLPGLPTYRPIGDFSTFALRSRCDRRARAAVVPLGPNDLGELARFLDAASSARPFAFVWREAKLRLLLADGLAPEDVLVLRRNGAIAGAVVVWDQRARRRTVVARLPIGLRLFRPVAALAAPLLDLPRPPHDGDVLAQATLTALALADEADADGFETLLAAGVDRAREKGLDVAVLGVPTAHPWRAMIRARRRGIEYRTRLHLAHWPEGRDAVAALGNAIAFPETGLL